MLVGQFIDEFQKLPAYPWLEEEQTKVADRAFRRVYAVQVRPQYKDDPFLAVVHWLLRPRTRWQIMFLETLIRVK